MKVSNKMKAWTVRGGMAAALAIPALVWAAQSQRPQNSVRIGQAASTTSGQGHGMSAGARDVAGTLQMPISNGCLYSASVNGKIDEEKSVIEGQKGASQHTQGSSSMGTTGQAMGSSTAREGQGGSAMGNEQQGLVRPDVNITAQVTCPNAATIMIEDSIASTGPLTREDLASALERRGAIATEVHGQRCVYMPDFEVSSTDIKAVGVSYACASPAKKARSQKKGGGEAPSEGARRNKR